jgi:hypothetical protein
MNPVLLLLFLAAPFILLGALVTLLIIVIGRQSARPK